MISEVRLEKLGASYAPLNKVVMNAIRERILSGEFPPGERLVEARLSDELGVSRMPVREALRALAAEGMVTIEPRRGATVTTFSDEQVREIVEVRATLEALNAKLAAKRHDKQQLARLEQIVAAGAKVADGADVTKLHEDNATFHEALASAADNSVLRDLVRSLRERTALIFAPHSRKRARENWEEHAAIVRAVVAGDAELAALLAARHVHAAAQALPQGAKSSSETSEPSADQKPPKPRRTGTR